MHPVRLSEEGFSSENAAYSKVRWKLIPFLFVLYVVAYLDRINVGFASLQMNRELGLSEAAFGFGAGIFFIGYFVFEIPSNLMLQRIGARIWISRIVISWGVVAMAMVLARGAKSFYLLRFLLGVTEAGFFPGIIFTSRTGSPHASARMQFRCS
jgi:ACS family tartrate transporter-like MFS transporter